MSPIARKLHPRGKVTSVLAFAFAVLASGYGVFTSGPLEVLSVRFPPGSVPVLVFLALVTGVVALRTSLGEERCRRCDRALVTVRRGHSAEQADRVAQAVELGDVARLGPAQSPESAPVVVELRHCPQCRQVAVVKAVQRGGTELTQEHILVGPQATEWVAHLIDAPVSKS